MQLSELPKITQPSKKRVGRGHGSGRGGHTSGRGHKGEKSRGKIGLFFEGTKFKKSLLKRLPLIRGKGKFKPQKEKPLIVNLKYLNLFSKDEEVTFATLQAKGIIAKDLPSTTPVKILGEGELKVPLKVYLPTSRQAREKIESAGGQVISSSEGTVSLAKENQVAEVKPAKTTTKTKKNPSKSNNKSQKTKKQNG